MFLQSDGMVPDYKNPLRLNVGFIIHESIGYFRDFEFELPELELHEGLTVERLSGVGRITRTPPGLLVQIRMQAEMPAECSRCLTEFQQPLAIDFTELYAFTPASMTDSGLLVPENGKIDLAPLVREEFSLAIPISPVCRPDCKGLCPVCGENLNQNDHTHDQLVTDPRLSDLKKLLDDDIG